MENNTIHVAKAIVIDHFIRFIEVIFALIEMLHSHLRSNGVTPYERIR
jgi:hypothetical protein